MNQIIIFQQEEAYSTIRLSSGKAHIYNTETELTLCGLNKWDWTPFHLNKRQYTAQEMLEQYATYPENSGCVNPYKWTCVRCEQKITKIINE